MASRVPTNSEEDISKLEELREKVVSIQNEMPAKRAKKKRAKVSGAEESAEYFDFGAGVSSNSILMAEEEVSEVDELERKRQQDKYIREIFGFGFTSGDYEELGRRFFEMQNNYPLRTAMHTEALVTYIKYAYKRDKAIADDDIDAADKWGKLAAKQATDAKINPSQLSAADLSDGMTSFSQLSAMVEKTIDIIPVLPKFVEEPKDRVDYTIWQYVNYIRDLEGKPLIKYKDLYQFLEARYKENKGKLKFNFFDGDGKFDTNDIGGDE